MNQISSAGNSGERIRSDCLVTFEPKSEGGITIELTSKVERLFGKQIRQQVKEVLRALDVEHASITMEDSGALPYVIGARLEAAIKKQKQTHLEWLPPRLSQNHGASGRDRFRFTRLYLPGNTPSMMLNAGLHQPSGIILDLEDSVAPEKKHEARYLVRNALRQVDFRGCERMVRINQLPEGLEDLKYVVPHHVQTILIPKCESPEEVVKVEEQINNILKEEQQEGPVYLMPIIESCLGIEEAFHIAKASENVVAMAIGLEDYTADLGVPRTAGGDESLYARVRLVNACKAAGIQPIDSVFSDAGDVDGLNSTIRRSRSLGFEGMGCIHPRQIPLIHEGFCPGEEEINRAEMIIQAYNDAVSEGTGVISLGTKMIDPPVVKRAMRTMELAGQFGLRKLPDQ